MAIFSFVCRPLNVSLILLAVLQSAWMASSFQSHAPNFVSFTRPLVIRTRTEHSWKTSTIGMSMIPNNGPFKPKSSQMKASSIYYDPSSSPKLKKVKAKISDTVSGFKTRFKTDRVFMWRTLAVAFLTSLFAFQPIIDANLVNLWDFLRHSNHLLARCFRHDHWEWQVAIWAFFVWIHGFWICDRLVQKAAEKGIEHPLKKYRLQDQYEREKWEMMMARRRAKNEVATDSEDMDNALTSSSMNIDIDIEKDAKPPMTKQAKWHLGFWIFELPLYVLPLYIWDICIPRRAAKIVAWNAAPTTLQICRDVTCGLLLYDLGFFVCHFFMHKIPFFYKYVHKKHHTTTEVRASDIVRLSGVEEVIDVGISILALNYLKCHPVSRTIYNLIITFLLTELHSGFAFPWTPQFVVPFGLSTGSKGHHYHHRNGKHYYQKFFCHVDKLFGFVEKKNKRTQGAVAA